MAIQAEIPQALVADSLTDGSNFVLKVLAAWQHGECRLTAGAVLHATVHQVTRNSVSRHVTSFAFVAQAPCGEKPLDVVVTSLLAPPKVEEILESFPSGNNLDRQTPGLANVNVRDWDASAVRMGQAFSKSTVVTNALPKAIGVGEVWHLNHVRLTLPHAGSSTSTVSTTGTSALRLPEKTVFVLQTALEERREVATESATGVRPKVEVARPIKPFLQECDVKKCTAYPPRTATNAFGYEHLAHSLDLVPYGYIPEHDREVRDLDLGLTVHFIGDNEVLVTFPMRSLLKRSGSERPTDSPRQIRAVLFDTETQTPLRTEDWDLDDRNAYIWTLGSNLLVHTHDALEVYGPGLKEIVSLPLTLPLASLRTSPDGAHVLIGELRELHTSEDHKLLTDIDSSGPQEEVLWSLLDGSLKPIRTIGISTNRVPAPVLLDQGMVELRKGQKGGWFLLGRSWDNNKEDQLGSLQSSCFPKLGAAAGNLLTIETCGADEALAHTFLVRENGEPAVDQKADSSDIPPSIATSAKNSTAALLHTRASNDYIYGHSFRLSTIKSQWVDVLRTDGGTVVASVPVEGAIYDRQAVALSPNGKKLAFLAGHQLLLFTIAH